MVGDVIAPRRILTLNPDWSKGFIDKFLVVRFNNDIAKVEPMCMHKLSHIQHANPGDVLIRVRHQVDGSYIHEDHFFLDSPTTMISRVKKTRDKLSNEIKQCIIAMRDPVNRMFSYLPGTNMDDIVFDCNVPRKARFIKVLERLDKEWYQFVVEQLSSSRNDDTPGDWRSSKLKPIPQFMNIRERLVVESEASDITVSHTSQHWLLFMEDGTTAWQPDAPATAGAMIDASTGKTIKVFSSAPVPMPKNVKRAIKFTVGLHPHNGKMVGVGWVLYGKKS